MVISVTIGKSLLDIPVNNPDVQIPVVIEFNLSHITGLGLAKDLDY